MSENINETEKTVDKINDIFDNPREFVKMYMFVMIINISSVLLSMNV